MSSSTPNRAPNLITASGALAGTPGLYHLNATGVLTLTMPLPTVDGIEVSIIDETGHAHTLTFTSPPTGLNAASGTLTWNGTAGSSCELVSRNGRWYSLNLNGVAVS